MGALAHYLEREGIPTTQISLIYEHTEAIRPPRALWVPFELGRPLGVPDDAVFQRKVLLAALRLLESETVPVLEAFSEEAPAKPDDSKPSDEAWACPVSFAPGEADATDSDKRMQAFQKEVAELRNWYDIGREKRGRTALSSFSPEDAANLLCDYLAGKAFRPPDETTAAAVALRLAAQDLKAFYYEAAISRPGAGIPDSETFTRWYWTQTAAGQILKDVKQRCESDENKEIRLAGKMFLVPMGY